MVPVVRKASQVVEVSGAVSSSPCHLGSSKETIIKHTQARYVYICGVVGSACRVLRACSTNDIKQTRLLEPSESLIL